MHRPILTPEAVDSLAQLAFYWLPAMDEGELSIFIGSLLRVMESEVIRQLQKERKRLRKAASGSEN